MLDDKDTLNYFLNVFNLLNLIIKKPCKQWSFFTQKTHTKNKNKKAKHLSIKTEHVNKNSNKLIFFF